MAISDELKAIYATAPHHDYYIETLELSHSAFTEGSRFITNQLSGLTAQLETGTEVFFEFLPFAAIPPQATEEGNTSLQVAIDNASRELMEQLELLAEAPTEEIVCKYRVYLASDVTGPQNDPPLALDIQSVTASNSLVAFTAGLPNLRKVPFPSVLYTTEQFPGLKR